MVSSSLQAAKSRLSVHALQPAGGQRCAALRAGLDLHNKEFMAAFAGHS